MKEKQNILPHFALAASLTLLSSAALANSVTVGLGAGWTDSPYKGTGSVYTPIPSIKFDNGLFYLDTFRAGMHVYNENNQTISVGLAYLPLHFKGDDSDDQRLKQLHKRKSTLLAEASYKLNTQYGILAARLGGDILSESDSIIVDASYSYVFSGDKWRIVPTAGVNWTNDKHNNYYYGVSHKESTRSGLAYHDAKSSFTPYVGVTGHYAVTKHIGAYAGVMVHQLTGDAKDSPMVANDTVPTVFMGVNYTF